MYLEVYYFFFITALLQFVSIVRYNHCAICNPCIADIKHTNITPG